MYHNEQHFNPRTAFQQDPPSPKPNPESIEGSNILHIGLGGRLRILRAEINSQRWDMIINPTNPQMEPEYNTVSARIHQLAGRALRRAMHNRYPNGLFLPPADHPETEAVNSPMQKYFQSVRHTPAYNLQNCNWITHTCVPTYLSTFQESGADLDEDNIEDIQNRNGRKYNSVWLALKRAHFLVLKLQARHFSVAIPEVQIGGGDFTPRDDAVLTLSAILDFFNHPEWGLRRRNSIDRIDILIDVTPTSNAYVAAYEFAWFKMNMHVPSHDIPRAFGAHIGGLERPFPVTLPQLPILDPGSQSEYGSILSTPRRQWQRRFSVLNPPFPKGWASVIPQEEIEGYCTMISSGKDGSAVGGAIDSGGADDNVVGEYDSKYPYQDDLFDHEPSSSESSGCDSTSSSVAVSETQNSVNPYWEGQDSQWLNLETPVNESQVAGTPVMFTSTIRCSAINSLGPKIYNEDLALEGNPAILSPGERSGDNTLRTLALGVRATNATKHKYEEIRNHELYSDFESTTSCEALRAATARKDADREIIRQELEDEIEKVLGKKIRRTGDNQVLQSSSSPEIRILGKKRASTEKDTDCARISNDQFEGWYAVANATTKPATTSKYQKGLSIFSIAQMSTDPEVVEEAFQPTKYQPQQQEREISTSQLNPLNAELALFSQREGYPREQAPSPDTPIKEKFSSNTPLVTPSATQSAIPEHVLFHPAHAGLPPKLDSDPVITQLSPKRNYCKLNLPTLDFPKKSLGMKEPRPSIWHLTISGSPIIDKSALADVIKSQGLNGGVEFKLAAFKMEKREGNTGGGIPMSPTARPTTPGPLHTSTAAPVPVPTNLLPASMQGITTTPSRRKRQRISEVEMLTDQTGLNGEYWAAKFGKRKRRQRRE
ncbi:hypothetical protein BGZ60DRAFT_532752 [Tricladium varicosporioides]|nr:hypothetical protein BGZ60DRAFT_532752 [Hymenoscyphus varicosporioides]